MGLKVSRFSFLNKIFSRYMTSRILFCAFATTQYVPLPVVPNLLNQNVLGVKEEKLD